MKMPYRVIIADSLSKDDLLVANAIITSTFAKIDRICNHWNPYSELSNVNRAKESTPLNISHPLSKLIQIADKIVNLSENRYDPTLGPIISCWKSALSQARVPDPTILLDKQRFVGWNLIHLENGKLTKEYSNVHINFDSIAKGYGVDLIVKEFEEAGFKNFLVEWAGEIATRGINRSKIPWQVEIYSPSENPRQIVSLSNGALATSGNYPQYFAITNEKNITELYSHLLNKKTLTPITLLSHPTISVTVKAPTCALADGLATAAMLFEDTNELKEWIKKVKTEIPETTFWVIGREQF